MLEIGNRYSLSTKAPGILGSRIERAKFSGKIDYQTANSFINVESLHRAVYPMLPVGTPISPKSFSYYIFNLESGGTKVLADAWIDEGTIELISTVTITVTIIANNSAEAEKIRESLYLLGHRNFTIDIK